MNVHGVTQDQYKPDQYYTLHLLADVSDLGQMLVAAPIGAQNIYLFQRSFRWHKLFRTCVLVWKFSEIPS